MKSWRRTAVLGLICSFALMHQSCFAADTLESLSPAAKEVAKDIGITPYILQLEEMREKSQPGEERKRDTKYQYIKQEMTEILLTTFLETRDVTADLDDEMSRSDELKSLLEQHRDRAIRLNTIANFVSGGGLQMISSGIQVGTGFPYANAGNTMEVVAGALSTGISTYALKQSSGEKRNAGVAPNTMAKIFDLPTSKDEEIPEAIWNYLNDPFPNSNGLSRRERLIQRWVQIGRIPPPKSKEGQRKIPLLCGSVKAVHQISIDLLDDRSAMLNDLRAAIGEMSGELLEILKLMRKL